MILLLRILVFLTMAGVAWISINHYAFQFHRGYPFWPVAVLAVLAFASSHLRHAGNTTPLKRPTYDHQSFDRLLLILLALAGAAAILNFRNEPPFQLPWVIRLATLTVFLHLVSSFVAAPFTRHHLLIHTLATLALIGVLWKGTHDHSRRMMESRIPLIFDFAVSRSNRNAS